MAALIDGSTGYNVITDYGSDSVENPSIGLFNVATGPQPYDDFDEVNSSEDSLDSGSSLENPRMLVQPSCDLLDTGAGGSSESWGLIGN